MAIEGTLKELGIQDVLQLLQLTGKTGELAVESERHRDEVHVHLDGGAIVFATRKRSSRRLGQLLIRAGKLTERELKHALETQKREPSQRLGRILIEMGSVKAEELARLIRFQIEETIYDILGWTDGVFRFEEREEVERGDVDVRVRVESLLMEGARRIDEWSRLESRIPNADAIPVLASMDEAGPATLELHPEDWEVLAEIDGERDLRQIAADLGRSSFDVARIVYGLVSAGVARVLERPIRMTERELEAAIGDALARLEAGDAKGAARVAASLQAAYPNRAELALVEGRALEAQGRMRAATEAYARAVALDPLSRPARCRLGFAAMRTGDFERAVEALDAFLRLEPDPVARRPIEEAHEAIRVLMRVRVEV